jgi:hypothetical protein
VIIDLWRNESTIARRRRLERLARCREAVWVCLINSGAIERALDQKVRHRQVLGSSRRVSS